ncbi:MAG: response regulator transcription factor [Anaerolineales bacterium]
MGTDEPISVFVVDDHSLFRRGLIALLREMPEFRVLGEAGEAETAFTHILQTRPQIVLLDVHMPSTSGLELLNWLRRAGFDGKILMLTVSQDEADVLKAIANGADGYLLKNIEPESLRQVLLDVVRGQAVLSSEVTRNVLDLVRRKGTLRPSQLTSREMEVLQALCDGKSTAQIAAQLFLSENTVKTHIRHIFEKMGVRNRTEAVARAVESGWVSPKV